MNKNKLGVKKLKLITIIKRNIINLFTKFPAPPGQNHCLFASIKLSDELSKNNIINEIIEGYSIYDEKYCYRHYWIKVNYKIDIDIGTEISNITWKN